MAVAFRAAGTPVLDTTSGPTVVAYPAGVAANDLLLIQFRVGNATAVTTPGGWTKLFGEIQFAGTTIYATVFYRVAGGSEPSTVSITKPNAPSMAVMSAYSGCDTTAPINVSASAVLATSGTTYTAPTATTTVANTQVLRMYWPWCFSGSGTTPNASDTERYDCYDSWDGGVHELGDRAQTVAGATGTSNATGPALNGGLAATIALAPLSAVAPVANFTGTPLTGTEPLSVVFTDSSTNTPTSWAWTFGDGGTSSSQNPTHSYAAAGTYTVTLIATNSAGSDTKTRTGYVTVAAILGNSHRGTGGSTGTASRNYCSKVTLASRAVLTELHGWFGSSGGRVQLTIYADNSGLPGALLAYTAPLTPPGGDAELSQTGFSLALSAGTYWIGWCGENTGTTIAYHDDPGSGVNHSAISSGAPFNPPANPYGSPQSQGTRQYSCWAVVTITEPAPIRILTTQGWADIGNDTSFVSGTGAPAVAVGATGAIYLDTVSHRIYGPKAAGAWPSTPLGVLVPDYTGVTNGWSLKIVGGVPAWSA